MTTAQAVMLARLHDLLAAHVGDAAARSLTRDILTIIAEGAGLRVDGVDMNVSGDKVIDNEQQRNAVQHCS